MLKRRQQWLVLLAFWTLIALSFASQFYIASTQAGLPISWRQAVVSSLLDWYVFALLSWPAIWLSRNFRLEGRAWLPNVGFHLAAATAFSVAYVLIRCLAGKLQVSGGTGNSGFFAMFRSLFLKTWHFNALIYWVIVSVTHAFDYYRKYQERTLRASELEKRLAQARLQALQMQLNPHFLFNTLNAISTLMRRDVEAADTMITRLGQLLRYGLENTNTQEVPLDQELLFLKRYLEIEQMRFGDRLKVIHQFPPETLNLLVPNLILQPLVENCIKHGIEPRSKPGEIRVSAQLKGKELILMVEDNGAGLPPGGLKREGVGISNSRSRLEHLYGSNQTMEITNGTVEGVRVTLKIPTRPATSP